MVVVEPMPVHSSTVLTRGNFRHGDESVAMRASLKKKHSVERPSINGAGSSTSILIA